MYGDDETTAALTKRQTLGILAGCCALLLRQEEGQGQEDTGGGESGDMERLSAALQALLPPPPPPTGDGASGGDEGQPPAPAAAAATTAAAAAAAQMLMLATPPRALPPARDNPLNPNPGGAATSTRASRSSSSRYSSSSSSSAFSTASSLGMSAAGGGGTGRKDGGSISTSSTTSSSHRRRHGLGKALAGSMEEEGEEGTAATMEVSEAGFSPSPASSPSSYSRRSSFYSANRSQHRASALLALCCGDGMHMDPREAVMNDGALVREIMTYLVPPSLTARPLLGQLSLVSPLWRAVSSSDTFWRPVSLALFPALPAALSNPNTYTPTTTQAAPEQQPPLPPPPSASTTAPTTPMALASTTEEDDGDASPSSPSSSVWQEGRSLCKRQVLAVGHALCMPRYRTTSAWQEGLSMMFEVMDERDGKRLFFGSGPVHVAVGQNVILRLAGTSRRETSTPFSAADRDPELHRFQSMKDFFKYSHAQQFPAALRVRVFICDDRSGQVALLYQSLKNTKRHAKSPNASYWQEFLPEHSLYVWDSDQVVYGQNAQAKLAAAFYVVPVHTEEDGGGDGDGDADGATQERDKLFVIAGGDEERYGLHSSYVSIDFSTSDNESVGKFVRSLLAAD